MKTLFSSLKWKFVYYILFVVFLLLALIVDFCFSKPDGFILLNCVHTKWLDGIFMVLTFLGDGLYSLLTTICLFYIKKYCVRSTEILRTYLHCGILAQSINRILQTPRLNEILNTYTDGSFMGGVADVGWDSFPTEPTTSFFALFTLIKLYPNKKKVCIQAIIPAVGIGYSKIYLVNGDLQPFNER